MLDSLTVGESEFPAEIARFGGRTTGVFAVSGRYDAVVVADFDDEAASLAFALAATSEGQYVEALRVYDSAELQRAESIARQAADEFLAELEGGQQLGSSETATRSTTTSDDE